MTTTTRKKKTTAKTTKKKARVTTDTKAKKQPKWSLVSYKQIEARRGELGISKSAMATLVGVTNSTYHNWRRGTTVPHEGQQEKILAAMHAGPSMVPEKAPKPKKLAARAEAVTAGRNGASASDPFGSPSFLSDDDSSDGLNGSDSHVEAPAESSRTFHQTSRVVVGGNRCGSANDSQSVSGQAQTRGVGQKVHVNETISRHATAATVTSAYIHASKGKASAASIIKLMEGLLNIL